MEFKTSLGTLHNLDCVEGLKAIPENSVEACVTDIPYGISFMAKEWDKGIPDEAIFTEIYRVLKKGAFFATTFTPRADMQLKLFAMLEKVGFNIEFSPIYWVYNSGFPKAMNYSKAVDKRLGCERETTGKANNFGSQDSGCYNYNTTGKNKTEYELKDVPVSEQAHKLDGWFSLSLKPAVEPIIIAQKPHNCKTKVECALQALKCPEYAIGGVNVDECRIPYKDAQDAQDAFISLPGAIFNSAKHPENRNKLISEHGRFPANLVVQDDALNDGTISRSSLFKSATTVGHREVYNESFGGFADYTGRGYNDEGSASRYFDIDAWYKEKLKKLPKEVQRTFPCLQVPKPASSEKNEGLDGFEEKAESDGCIRANPETARKYLANPTKKQNFHPTCKPQVLFSYLIKLFARPGEVVLDPFMGSGTTALACEQFGYKWLGYEMQKEYYEIAVGRLQEWGKQTRLWVEA